MFDLGLTSLLWGFSFALAKKALNVFTPLELVFIRLLLGSLTVYLMCRFFYPQALKEKTEKKTALIIGTFEFAGTYIFYMLALKYLPSGIVGTLTLLTPIFTYAVSLFAGVAFFSLRGVLAVFLSVFGASLCLPLFQIFSQFDLNSPAITGTLLILISNLFFAIGNVAITRSQNRQKWSQALTFKGQGIGALFALVVCLVANEPLNPEIFQMKNWFLPLYLGVVATGFGFFLWNRGVQKVSATPASVIGNFKAPFSLLWGFILLGEPVSWRLFVGLILLFSATLVLPRSQKSRT